jgi:DNA ligase-1
MNVDTKNLPKLFGRSSTGKIKEWSVTTDGADVVITHGQEGGKLQESRTTSAGKNLGKANETSPSEQAILESRSKWNKQIDKGYAESESGIPNSTLPNLAHSYQKRSHDVKWPCHALLKFDGVRCTIFYRDGKMIFQTRGGKEYPVIKEIDDQLSDVFFMTESCRDYVIDGELYCHGMHLEDITSAVKKHNENTHKIDFMVFDVIDKRSPEKTWIERFKYYTDCFDKVESLGLERVYATNAIICEDEEHLIGIHASAISRGFEGIILRNLHGLNVFGERTVDRMKYKVRLDAEFKVVDIVQDKHGCGIPVCEVETPEGVKTFKAPLIGDKQYQKDVYWSYCHGCPDYQWLTVEYEKLSKYGIPAKPKGKCFREVIDGEVQT